jgi:hypothetical protein
LDNEEGRMSKLTQIDIVKELLRTYQDVTGTLNGAGDWQGGKPGSRVLYRDPFKSPYYAGSYRDLEAILRHMSAGGGLEGEARYELAKWSWAISQSYILCERRMVERQVKRKAKNNRTVTVVERFTQPVGNAAVRPEEREKGEKWISDEFTRRGILPELPREIFQALAA